MRTCTTFIPREYVSLVAAKKFFLIWSTFLLIRENSRSCICNRYWDHHDIGGQHDAVWDRNTHTRLEPTEYYGMLFQFNRPVNIIFC